MVWCIEIETASLIFAYLSLLITSLGSLACIGMVVYANVLMVNLITGVEGKLSADAVEEVTIGDLAINIVLAVFLSILVVTFAFSIILTKGLLSKKAHLVKAYFVYGVSLNTLAVISHFSLFLNVVQFIPLGFASLFGCFLYGLVLVMIRRTYLKLSHTDHDHFCHKKLQEEKSNDIFFIQ